MLSIMLFLNEIKIAFTKRIYIATITECISIFGARSLTEFTDWLSNCCSPHEYSDPDAILDLSHASSRLERCTSSIESRSSGIEAS